MGGEEFMIVFIGCVKSKINDNMRHPAHELYTSELFKKSLRYARLLTSDDKIFILSAKYGLLGLNDEIEYYNDTLIGKSQNIVASWSFKVRKQITERHLNDDTAVFLASQTYIQYLKDLFGKYEVPLEGLSIGRRLKYLNEKTEVMK